VTGDIISKIKSRGYWFVNVRPLKFEKEKLKSLAECAELVKTCSVRLRGWPYPYVNANVIKSGVDWVQGEVDSGSYIEYWRMHQSGQFAHLFACREDWWKENSLFGGEHLKKIEPMSTLEVLMTLFTLTEIYEFAARLAEKKLFEEALNVTVELHGMKGRKLIFIEPFRTLFDEYVCAVNDLPRSLIISVEDVLGKAHELALDHAIWVFERFNWRSVRRDILQKDQEKLLQKR
jgi:hypothetical protein